MSISIENKMRHKYRRDTMSWEDIIKSDANLIDDAKIELIKYINKYGMSRTTEKDVEMFYSKRGSLYGKARVLSSIFNGEMQERRNLSPQQIKYSQASWNSLTRTMDLVDAKAYEIISRN